MPTTLQALRTRGAIAIALLLVSTHTVAATDGAVLYQQHCALCHQNAVGGAPKLGDKSNWATRFKGGIDPMVASVIKGKGQMPPRAATKLTDTEIRTVVEYLATATR